VISRDRARARWKIALRAIGIMLMAEMLVVTATIALRVTGSASLSGLPPIGGLDYSVDHIARLGPLNVGFLVERLGARDLEAVLGAAPSIGGAQAPAPPQRQGPTTAGETAPVDTRDVPLTNTPSLRKGQWNLHVLMFASPSTVRPGQEIIYTIEIRNVGTADYLGQPGFSLSSHVPFHTTYSEPSPCGGVGIDPATSCFDPTAPEPGVPSEQVHQVHFVRTNQRIGRGRSYLLRFHVRVGIETPAGTRLLNHAHLFVGAGAEQRTPDVVVKVE